MALDIRYTKEHHPARWFFALVLIALLGATGWFGYRWYMTGETPFSLPLANAGASEGKSDVTPAQVSAYSVSGNHPRYISVPSLDVGNTRVFPVKLDARNQLQAAANSNDATWYDQSATPGSGGVVLISGSSSGASSSGLFGQLKAIEVGSQILIKRGDGTLITYKVFENQSLTLGEVETTGTKKMNQPVKASAEGLNIITTDGKWVPRLGTFDRRLLIRATILDQ